MTLPRLSALLVAVLALAAALVVRRRRGVHEHVELHYEDGAVITLDAGNELGDRLLAIGRDALPGGG